MPIVRCKWYEADGNPIKGGCRRQSGDCQFVHPSSPYWGSAPPSRATGLGRGNNSHDWKNPSRSDEGYGGRRHASSSRGGERNAETRPPSNDYRDTTTWKDSSSGFPEQAPSGWGHEKQTERKASAGGWGDSGSNDTWGKTTSGEGWGNLSSSGGWGQSDSKTGWGNSTSNDVQRKTTTNDDWGKPTANDGWGVSNSSEGWGDLSSLGKSSSGTGRERSGENKAGGRVGWGVQPATQDSGWGDLSDLNKPKSARHSRKSDETAKEALPGSSTSWGVETKSAQSTTWASSPTMDSEREDKGKTRAVSPQIGEQEISHSSWGMDVSNKPLESAGGWGQPPPIPRKEVIDAQEGKAASGSTSWGQTSSQIVPSQDDGFTQPGDSTMTPITTNLPVSQGWPAPSASIRSSPSRQADLLSRHSAIVDESAKTRMDIDISSSTTAHFIRSGSIASTSTIASISNDPNKLVERLIFFQRQISAEEERYKELKAYASQTCYSHAGRAARLRLDTLISEARTSIHDLKRREQQCLDALVAFPSLAAQARAAEEGRKETEDYLTEVQKWLDAAEPVVEQAINARKAQVIWETERPSKRARIDSETVDDIDDASMSGLKADMDSLSMGLSPYKEIHAGFANAAKRLELLEKQMVALRQPQEHDTEMAVDGEHDDGGMDVSKYNGEDAGFAVMHSTASHAVDRLEGTIVELRSLVLSCQKDGLAEKAVLVKEEVADLKSKVDQFMQSHNPVAIKKQVDDLQLNLQSVQEQYEEMVNPTVPQETIQQISSVITAATLQRIAPYFEKLDALMDENLEKTRQDFLRQTTDRLTPVVEMTSKTQDYIHSVQSSTT